MNSQTQFLIFQVGMLPCHFVNVSLLGCLWTTIVILVPWDAVANENEPQKIFIINSLLQLVAVSQPNNPPTSTYFTSLMQNSVLNPAYEIRIDFK